jgi:hypothetical protein
MKLIFLSHWILLIVFTFFINWTESSKHSLVIDEKMQKRIISERTLDSSSSASNDEYYVSSGGEDSGDCSSDNPCFNIYCFF